MCLSTAVATSAPVAAEDFHAKAQSLAASSGAAQSGEGSPSVVELDIVGALCGDVCCKVLAEPSWTVSRIKGEIARLKGTPITDQILLLGCTRLQDSAIVGTLDLGHGKGQMTLLRNAARNAGNRSSGLTVASEGNCSRVSWSVDAKLLMRRDAPASSAPFELELGGKQGSCTFKLFISAQDGSSFKRKGGKARMQLKCVSDVVEDAAAKVACSFSIEAADPKKSEASRGPVLHNFGQSALCNAPQEIDLCGLAGSQGGKFVVCVEVARPGPCAVAGTTAAMAGA